MNKENINIDDLKRECLECGQEFIPDESGQECCCNECDALHYEWDMGYDDLDDYGYECDAEYYGTDWNEED
jgi:hypothetical protein